MPEHQLRRQAEPDDGAAVLAEGADDDAGQAPAVDDVGAGSPAGRLPLAVLVLGAARAAAEVADGRRLAGNPVAALGAYGCSAVKTTQSGSGTPACETSTTTPV